MPNIYFCMFHLMFLDRIQILNSLIDVLNWMTFSFIGRNFLCIIIKILSVVLYYNTGNSNNWFPNKIEKEC